MGILEAAELLRGCQREQAFTYADTFTVWRKDNAIVARGHNSMVEIGDTKFYGSEAHFLVELGIGVGSNCRVYKDGKWVDVNV